MIELGMGELFYGYVQSPIGLIEIGGTENAVVSLSFCEQRRCDARPNPAVAQAIEQVEAYFDRRRHTFDCPIALHGTAFQQRVWQQLLAIPYGQTASYGDVAATLGNPKAVRAVGAANGQNPISIIVPCHRVVGSDGRLVGYGGGLWRKEWLLRHEGTLIC